jgi:hypothetical protein
MATETLRPDGNGSYQQWDGTEEGAGSGTHWQKVDEAIADEDTTYVYADSINISDDYTLGATAIDTVAGDVITNVRVYVRAKRDSAASLRAHVDTGATARDYGSDQAITGAYADYFEDWAVDPWTTVAWTTAVINDLRIGVQTRSAVTNWVRITQMWAVITYTPAAGVSVPVMMHHHGHTIAKIIRG